MRRTLILLTALLPALAASAHPTPDGRRLLGFVEWVTLEPLGLDLKARLDTGALTSSLHAVDPEPFERDGEKWVRFRIPLDRHLKDQDPAEFTLERPVKRVVLVKRKGTTPQRRYVVSLPICLDGRSHETEFSLTDRSNFLYPVLLGRRFLADVAIVDSAEPYLARQPCETGSQNMAG